MANETRKRANFITGTIDNNPLTNSGTTLTSDELIALPAVDATEHMPIILDPTGAGNGPEVVWVTAHTAGSSNATIVRGREGTSGVQHTSVRTWAHGPTINDFLQQVTTANRPSGTGLPYKYQTVWDVTLGQLIYYDGAAWQYYMPIVPHAVAVNRITLTATNAFTNQSSYTTMPDSTDATALRTSGFIKYRADTRILIHMSCSAQFDSGIAQALFMGMRRDSTTDYDVAMLQYAAAANQRLAFSGETQITGLAAGTYQWDPVFRSETGAAIFRLYSGDDMISYTITEIL